MSDTVGPNEEKGNGDEAKVQIYSEVDNREVTKECYVARKKLL